MYGWDAGDEVKDGVEAEVMEEEEEEEWWLWFEGVDGGVVEVKVVFRAVADGGMQ